MMTSHVSILTIKFQQKKTQKFKIEIKKFENIAERLEGSRFTRLKTL